MSVALTLDLFAPPVQPPPALVPEPENFGIPNGQRLDADDPRLLRFCRLTGYTTEQTQRMIESGVIRP